MDPISITIGVIAVIVTSVGAYYGRKQYIAMKTPTSVDEYPKPLLEKADSHELLAPQPAEQDFSPYKRWLRSETLYIDIRGIAVGSKVGRDAITFPIVNLYAELYVQKGPTNLDVDDGRIRSIRLTD